MRNVCRSIVAVFFCVVALWSATSNALSVTDSLPRTYDVDSTELSQADLLKKLWYVPATFDVQIIERPDKAPFPKVKAVRFQSPKPIGDPVVDTVGLWWYVASDVSSEITPAVLIVPEMHPLCPVAHATAQRLSQKGIHAFVWVPPGWPGRSKLDEVSMIGKETLEHSAMAVADVRRSRDVIAALPGTDAKRIGVLGISMGGVFATLGAGMDDHFDSVYLMATGGSLVDVLSNGKWDALWLRHRLEAEGWNREKWRSVVGEMEPCLLAPRISASKVWMQSFKQDGVFPKKCIEALATSLSVPKEQHLWFSGNHYALSSHVLSQADRCVAVLQEKPVTWLCGEVAFVPDGDTLRLVSADNTSVWVRLDGIDAPEREQRFGKESCEALIRLAGEQIKVEVVGIDKYGRTIGRVWSKGVEVNMQLLAEGYAWHSAKYNDRKDYAKATKQARDAKIGLWQDSSPTPPWKYRKAHSQQSNEGNI